MIAGVILSLGVPMVGDHFGALLVLGSSLTVNEHGVEVIGFLWIGRTLRC